MDVCGTFVCVFASLEVTRCSKASDFCGVVTILRENSSKSILFLRAVILCNQISPVDYSPTGVAAAAADGPNLGCCDVSRKLKTISIKI